MSGNGEKLVLASASPRRKILLEQIGCSPDLCCPVEVDETPKRNELPRVLALRLAKAKAYAACRLPEVEKISGRVFIIAADTIVACGRRVIAKPESEKEVREALKLMAGRAHKVYTGVYLIAPGDVECGKLVETKVRFRRLSPQDINSYIESSEWQGKAGAYAIQGKAAVFVRAISGSYSGVVGLPLQETFAMLNGNGYPCYRKWIESGLNE